MAKRDPRKPTERSVNKKFRTVEAEFNSWIREVWGPQRLTRVERQKLKRAFYSGAFVLLSLQSDLAKENSEEDAIAKMDYVLRDLTQTIMSWNKG